MNSAKLPGPIQTSLLRFTETAPFHRFTFPGCQANLWTADSNGPVQAIGAWVNGLPAGLALSFKRAENMAWVASLYVAPAFRRHGVGAALLDLVEANWRSRGVPQLEMGYAEKSADADALLRLMASRNWPASKPALLLYTFDRHILESAFFAREPTLPERCAIIAWSGLTTRQRAAFIAEQLLNPWVPAVLNPLKYEGLAEFNSLALLEAGRLAGWLITERFDAQTLMYSTGYVRPDRQKLGWVVNLYAEAVRRQMARADTPLLRAVIPHRFPTMVNFMRKRMQPHAIDVQDYLVSIKTLAAQATN